MSDEIHFIEYEPADDGGYWRLERPDLLEGDFGVRAADLERWHRFIVRTKVWEFVRRLYQVGALAEDDPDILRGWTRAEVAKRFGIPVKEVDHDLAAAAEAWRIHDGRENLARQAAAEAGGDAAADLERLLAVNNRAGLGDEMVGRVLDAFGFGDVRGDGLRLQVANRILSLREYLESQHTKAAARQLIRWEISLHHNERLLIVYNNRMEEILERDPKLTANDGEMEVVKKKASDLEKLIRETTDAHKALQKEIGADEADRTTQKRRLIDTMGFLMEMCAKWETDPDEILVDRVFTAGEVDWLLQPLGERPPLYRADIVTRMSEALRPENLWNPDYKPTKIQVRVTQELARLVRCMREVPEDAAPLPVADEDEDAVPLGTNAAVMLPEVDAPGDGTGAVPMLPRRAGAAAGPVMGAFS